MKNTFEALRMEWVPTPRTRPGRTFHATLDRLDRQVLARCLEVDIASHGSSPEEALLRLQSAVAFWIDTVGEVPETEIVSFELGRPEDLGGALGSARDE